MDVLNLKQLIKNDVSLRQYRVAVILTGISFATEVQMEVVATDSYRLAKNSWCSKRISALEPLYQPQPDSFIE